MAQYEFGCLDCQRRYVAFTTYDTKGIYPDVACPECQSTSKCKLISKFFVGGATSSKMENFGFRAGFNMEKAQNERRYAEEFSHVGADPYGDTNAALADAEALGEGIHDPTERCGLS